MVHINSLEGVTRERAVRERDSSRDEEEGRPLRETTPESLGGELVRLPCVKPTLHVLTTLFSSTDYETEEIQLVHEEMVPCVVPCDARLVDGRVRVPGVSPVGTSDTGGRPQKVVHPVRREVLRRRGTVVSGGHHCRRIDWSKLYVRRVLS